MTFKQALLGYLFVVLPLTTLWAQTKNPAPAVHSDGKEVFIEFSNGVKINKDEFEYVYQKNNGGVDSARHHKPEKYKEYLELYVKFKRKVMEAQRLGIDTTESFKAELATYVKQLAQPYLIEKEVLNALIKEAYDRTKAACKVSHILIKLEEQPAPADTVKAYQKALAIRDSILKMGKKFDMMAARHSEEPNANQTKGYLSYFSAFDFLYSFENAAFNTPVGQVSMPVRSKYGYHLIFVQDKIQLKGLRKASHILVRHGKIYVAKDSAQAAQRAQEIYNRLQKGEDFATIAKEFSDDPNSKTKGGELGTRYIPIQEMQDMKYKLEPGKFTQPFKTQYGWHIMMVTEEPIKPFDDVRNEMKKKVTSDGRAQIAEDRLLSKLKAQYNYQESKGAISKLAENAGNDYLTPGYTGEKLPPVVLESSLFTFKDKKATTMDLINYTQRNRRRPFPPNTKVEAALEQDIEGLAKNMLLEYEEKQLADKYPEFRNLMQEYRDGILLFTITEEKVWRKAVEDTAGLRGFYDQNKEKFKAGERVRIREYRSRDRAALDKVDSVLKIHKKLDDVDTLIRKEKFGVRVTKHIYDKNSENGKKYFGKPVGTKSEVENDAVNYFINVIDDFLPAGNKSYDEAKSEAITQYQTYLEEKWNKELESSYTYKVNDKVFPRLFK